MSCRDIERKLGPYIDGELPGAGSVEVESHVAGCGRCAAEAGRLRTLKAVAAGLFIPAVADGEWAALRRRVEADGERVARGEKVVSFPRRASPFRLLPACAAALVVAGLLAVSGGPGGRVVTKPSGLHADDGLRNGALPAGGPEPVIQSEGEDTLLKYVDF